MKILKIENGLGHYRAANDTYAPIDKINKEDLLRLVNLTLEQKDMDFDAYDENGVKNHAHQIIYKNVVQKLQALRARRKAFIDESERLYLAEYEKYREDDK